MLILTRKQSEKIYVGDDIVITVVQLHGDKVSIGVDAPKAIPVHREEIYKRILAARTNLSQPVPAAAVTPPDATIVQP